MATLFYAHSLAITTALPTMPLHLLPYASPSAGVTFSARGPLGPCPSLKVTRCPSLKSSKRQTSTFEQWKNKSFSPPVSMKPNPLSVNLLIVPSAIEIKSKKTRSRGFAGAQCAGPSTTREKLYHSLGRVPTFSKAKDTDFKPSFRWVQLAGFFFTVIYGAICQQGCRVQVNKVAIFFLTVARKSGMRLSLTGDFAFCDDNASPGSWKAGRRFEFVNRSYRWHPAAALPTVD